MLISSLLSTSASSIKALICGNQWFLYKQIEPYLYMIHIAPFSNSEILMLVVWNMMGYFPEKAQWASYLIEQWSCTDVSLIRIRILVHAKSSSERILDFPAGVPAIPFTTLLIKGLFAFVCRLLKVILSNYSRFLERITWTIRVYDRLHLFLYS